MCVIIISKPWSCEGRGRSARNGWQWVALSSHCCLVATWMGRCWITQYVTYGKTSNCLGRESKNNNCIIKIMVISTMPDNAKTLIVYKGFYKINTCTCVGPHDERTQ